MLLTVLGHTLWFRFKCWNGATGVSTWLPTPDVSCAINHVHNGAHWPGQFYIIGSRAGTGVFARHTQRGVYRTPMLGSTSARTAPCYSWTFCKDVRVLEGRPWHGSTAARSQPWEPSWTGLVFKHTSGQELQRPLLRGASPSRERAAADTFGRTTRS